MVTWLRCVCQASPHSPLSLSGKRSLYPGNSAPLLRAECHSLTWNWSALSLFLIYEFIQSFTDISMDSWIFILCFVLWYNTTLLILLLKLFHLWPLGALPCSFFDIPPLPCVCFFVCFPFWAFSYFRVVKDARLLHFLSQSWNQPFLQGTLACIGEWH